MTSNNFFQRNTISNWKQLHPQRQGLAKVRSKRAQSHSQLKIDSSKFQHREVFDSKIYQKVNFFQLGLKDLKQNFNKDEKNSIFIQLKTILKQLSTKLNDKNIVHLSKGYINYWGLVPEFDQKLNIMQAMTEMMIQMFKKISFKFQELRKAKQYTDQYLLRLKVDLKLNKEKTVISENESKLNDRNQDRQKKLHEKIRVLDFELKKQTLKSEQLEQQLIEKGKQISKLKQQNFSMQEQKQQQKSYRQTMQFKVKRLKEELEVAHIIKEQNLADKMKYIMNW